MSFMFSKTPNDLGKFPTPSYIARFIVEQTITLYVKKNNSIEGIKGLKILEPSCGSGIFLVNALEILTKIIISRITNKKRREIDINKIRRTIIANNLYGIDLDLESVKLTQINLQYPSFTINCKNFNAICLPPKFGIFYPVEELKLIREQIKNYFINDRANHPLIEQDKRLHEIEKNIFLEINNYIYNELGLEEGEFLLPMTWELIFPETEGKFDIIFGNPPWGTNSALHKGFKHLYEVGGKQVDSWSLFVEKTIKSLNIGGLFSFVLPNTLLQNENYSVVRQMLLENTKILWLINLGEDIFQNVTQPSLILLAEKKSFKEEPDNLIKIIKYIPPEFKEELKKGIRSFSSLPMVFCTQKRFIENNNFELDIFSLGFESITKTIEKNPYKYQLTIKPLRELVTNARGVELNKRGKIIQCSYCKAWTSPPLYKKNNKIPIKYCSQCDSLITEKDLIEFIVVKTTNDYERFNPYFVGEDINRYFLSNMRYIDRTKQGINYKNPKLYKGRKLLLRKTGKGIKTVIDEGNRWVSQVVYIFKIRNTSPVPLEYIMGILNSPLMETYFYTKFSDPFRKKFPHFTQKRFLEIPIRVPISSYYVDLAEKIGTTAILLQTMYQQKYISSKLSRSDEKLDSLINSYEDQINCAIFDMYEIPTMDRELILSKPFDENQSF